MFKYERKRGRDFKGRRVVWTTTTTRKARGRIVDNQDNLAELGQKIATETAEPIKATAAKYYKPAA